MEEKSIEFRYVVASWMLLLPFLGIRRACMVFILHIYSVVVVGCLLVQFDRLLWREG